jgi:hypothetical protein
MDYKQKYLKYKQKYLNLLKDQKGGEPFLMDILAGPVFSYLFERNQRQLRIFYNVRAPVMMQPLGNFTLNNQYRLKLLGISGLSITLARRLVEGSKINRFQLAKRILSHTHELPKISPPTLAATLVEHNGGVHSVVFHPTLPLLATGSSDYTTKLWRFSSDRSVTTCVATLPGYSDSFVSGPCFFCRVPPNGAPFGNWLLRQHRELVALFT